MIGEFGTVVKAELMMALGIAVPGSPDDAGRSFSPSLCVGVILKQPLAL